jgi:hypothetical protein
MSIQLVTTFTHRVTGAFRAGIFHAMHSWHGKILLVTIVPWKRHGERRMLSGRVKQGP